jgi:hypothetical protein
MKFETIAIPFEIEGNETFLTDERIARQPALLDFVETFRHCFERDEYRCRLVYRPPLNS